MNEGEKRNKFYFDCQELKDKLEIISSLPEEVLQRYDFNLNKIMNKLNKLTGNNINGRVYSMQDKGYINENGYQKKYLFMFDKSCIKEDKLSCKEHFSIIDKNGNKKHIMFADIGSNMELSNNGNNLYKVYKYIPESKKKINN